MRTKYYKIPIKSNFFDEDTLSVKKETISKAKEGFLESNSLLIQAIRQNLNLLFLSHEGELQFERKYGLEVWNHNFETKKLKHDDRKVIEEEIFDDINSYEKRLKIDSHKIEVLFVDENKFIDGKKADLHILDIFIESVLNENFKSKETHFTHRVRVPVKVYYNL